MTDYKRKFEDDCEDSKGSKQWLFTEINRELQVSTCYRQSSCIYPSWFYETFIWQVGEDRERELIGDATGAGLSHFQICEWIIKNGGWDQDKFYQELENDRHTRLHKRKTRSNHSASFASENAAKGLFYNTQS